jgi:hypothetical protein
MKKLEKARQTLNDTIYLINSMECEIHELRLILFKLSGRPYDDTLHISINGKALDFNNMKNLGITTRYEDVKKMLKDLRE